MRTVRFEPTTLGGSRPKLPNRRARIGRALAHRSLILAVCLPTAGRSCRTRDPPWSCMRWAHRRATAHPCSHACHALAESRPRIALPRTRGGRL